MKSGKLVDFFKRKTLEGGGSGTYKRIIGICRAYINKLLQLNNSSTAEINEMLILLIYLGNTLEKKKEAARFLFELRDVGITSPLSYAILNL